MFEGSFPLTSDAKHWVLPLEMADDFVTLSEADGLAIDLRYASTNNFLGRNLYGAFRTLVLHRHAADKLRQAVALLAQHHPGTRFLVFDGLRPNQAQETMWAAVVGSPMQAYVADPRIGSIHNYGLAIDLSLQDQEGREIDMGTGFDDLTPLAEPRLEGRFLAEGRLNAAQVRHRTILRRMMELAGFRHLPYEWWHFDAEAPERVRQTYRRLP